MEKITNVPVRVAAKMMGKSEMFVRIGLRNNRFPFGVGVKNPGGRWSYQISPAGFCAYQGCTLADIKYVLCQN